MKNSIALSVSILFAMATFAHAQEEKPVAPGLGDPGTLKSIAVDNLVGEQPIVVSGRDAGQQLIVTGTYDSGQQRDLTREAEFTTSQDGIVQVSSTGYVTPIAEGDVTVRVRIKSGPDTSVNLKVTNIVVDLPVNFGNEITPVFTKYGCNGGGCHGKSSGQNGFRLSLLGFEPDEDYEFLVKEGRGRRVFPAAPERSLLLQKAAGVVPHGGGARLEVKSASYNLLSRWIEQGMPYGNEDDPVVTHIEVQPVERLMQRDGTQQISVIAHFSDGSTRDVTRTTAFDSNSTEMAEVDLSGLVTTSQLTGSVAVMARYQGHVGVFRATVPLGIKVDQLPKANNFVDDLVFKKLVQLGLPSSIVSEDAVFMRRVTVDIAGRLPTLEESEAFLSSTDENKRAAWIDHLLAGTDYADYFANKWNAVLRNKRRADGDKLATYGFHDWIRNSLHENKPYDQFVSEIVTATGTAGSNPAVAWYREVKDQAAQVEDTAQLFLGLRIQCARCHHHPFEKWSQEDYYGFAAFFSRVGRKKSDTPGYDRVFYNQGKASAKNPKTGNNVPPTGLGSEPLDLAIEEDPRQHLAAWMSDPSNEFFAKALVNRYWKHFFGRGLVDPEDDMRVTNPATNPELLDALAADFVKSGFDLKHLIRTIAGSSTYQLSSEPNTWNKDDKQNFSRYYPKRLNAEVLLDSIDQVTGTTTSFAGVPAGTRASQLPDNGFSSYFLTVFGRPESSSACECERSSEANLAQSLHLLNSGEIQGKLTSGSGRAALLSKESGRDHSVKIRDLYLLSFSREPTAEEQEIALAHIEKTGDAKIAYEDIVWALINTKEFLFNH
ncbi:MAG: DUF1553 domain-containing protein [Planctomycetota bacterium]|nr:DUF1553 domain-containing protein [Planctomycetota bacterium]